HQSPAQPDPPQEAAAQEGDAAEAREPRRLRRSEDPQVEALRGGKVLGEGRNGRQIGARQNGGFGMGGAVSATTGGDVTAWHAMPADEVVKRLTTDTGKGLAADDASSRLAQYGPNRLPAGKQRGPLMRFLSQFNNVLVYVLLGAGFTKMM